MQSAKARIALRPRIRQPFDPASDYVPRPHPAHRILGAQSPRQDQGSRIHQPYRSKVCCRASSIKSSQLISEGVWTGCRIRPAPIDSIVTRTEIAKQAPCRTSQEGAFVEVILGWIRIGECREPEADYIRVGIVKRIIVHAEPCTGECRVNGPLLSKSGNCSGCRVRIYPVQFKAVIVVARLIDVAGRGSRR